MIPPITERLISEATQSQKMLLAGQRYWAQGHVKALEIDDGEGVVTAKVEGSGGNTYIVTISFLEEHQGQFVVDVDCDCPVGFGCKHGAAVLFALQGRGRQRPGRPAPALPGSAAAVPPPVPVAALPVPLLNWLSEAQAIAKRRTDSPAASRIFYVFKARRLHAGKAGKAAAVMAKAALLPQQLIVTARMDEPAENSGRRSSQVHPYHAQLARDPIDAWLIRRMNSYGGDFDAAGSPDGVGGAEWLRTAIATGRAHWGKADGPVLHKQGIQPPVQGNLIFTFFTRRRSRQGNFVENCLLDPRDSGFVNSPGLEDFD